jgi:hypothetical protein
LVQDERRRDQAGEPILDIVPTEDDLVIGARVSPNDIDAVKPGLTAHGVHSRCGLHTRAVTNS